MKPRTAGEWSDAVDTEQRAREISPGDLVSYAHANGSVAGIEIDPNAPEADYECSRLVSTNGWVIHWDKYAGYWYAVDKSNM